MKLSSAGRKTRMINLAWVYSWKVTFTLLIGAGCLFAVFGTASNPRSGCNIFLTKSIALSDCVPRALKQCNFCKRVSGFCQDWLVLGGKERQESAWCLRTISISRMMMMVVVVKYNYGSKGLALFLKVASYVLANGVWTMTIPWSVLQMMFSCLSYSIHASSYTYSYAYSMFMFTMTT